MSSRFRAKVAFFAACICWGARGAAQQPLGNEFVVASAPANVFSQLGPEMACDRASVCGVFWLAVGSGDEPEPKINQIWGATYSPQGELLARRLLHEGTPAIVAPPIPLANGFALFWDRFLPSVRAVPVLQMFDEFLRPFRAGRNKVYRTLH